MRRRALALTASAAAVGLVLLGASPASAASLPATDQLHGLTGAAYYSTTSTGASTYISDLPQPDDGKYGADFDVTTGNAYYFADSGSGCDLYSLVPATGVSTLVGFVTDTGFDECDALNVASDGTLRVADQDGVMLTVDKTTAATISSVTIAGAGDEIAFIEQSSTGAFYIGTYGGELYSLDVATGATVFIDQPTDYFESASFDSSDRLWFSTDGVECQGLSSLSMSDPTGTLEVQGDFNDGVDCLSVYAIFIAQAAPVPAQLASTGSSAAASVAPFALLALIAGAGALMMARRTRNA